MSDGDIEQASSVNTDMSVGENNTEPNQFVVQSASSQGSGQQENQENQENVQDSVQSSKEDINDYFEYIEPSPDPCNKAITYLEQHSILQLFQQLTTNIVYNRPSDPIDYMIAEIKEMKKNLNSGDTNQSNSVDVPQEISW